MGEAGVPQRVAGEIRDHETDAGEVERLRIAAIEHPRDAEQDRHAGADEQQRARVGKLPRLQIDDEPRKPPVDVDGSDCSREPAGSVPKSGSCHTGSWSDRRLSVSMRACASATARSEKSYQPGGALFGMTRFADRVERISISGIREVFEAAGEDAINLGLGQPDFPTPEHARQAAVDAIEAGDADGYTENKGRLELREAIAAKHRRDQGIEVDPADIIATSGGSEALHIALAAHVDAGQEVIIPDPGFVSYDALTKLVGGEPVPVGLRDDLTLDPAAVERAITDDTAAFVINSPANPTGAVASESDIREFAHIADEHDVVCVSDEVYEYTVFEGEHHSPIQYAESDNVVVVNSASKLFSMTGWRLGWVTAASERIERMLRVHQYTQACASAPAQFAAEAALDGPQDVIEAMTDSFQRRRDILLDGLAEYDIECPTPHGAFYAMPRVPEGFVDECIDRGVIVVPGEAFGDGGEGLARISYATDEETLREAIEIMGEAAAAVR